MEPLWSFSFRDIFFISFLQGTHHVAQKFTRSSLPVGFLRRFVRSRFCARFKVTGCASTAAISAFAAAFCDAQSIAQPAVAEVGHSVQAAPLTARSVRHALTSHERIAGAKAEGMEIAANTSPAAMERASVAPVEDKPSADEVSTLKPITLKSITIAPIQIAALN